MARQLVGSHKDLPRIGMSQRPSEDAARFSQEPSLAFAPTTVWKVVPTGTARIGRVFVNFLGMLGPNGPLPLHLTDYAHDRELNHHDSTLARFLDVFNHRMVSLFYRAWSVNQLPSSFDRSRWSERAGAEAEEEGGERVPAPVRNDDRYATYVGSLFGIGMRTLRERDAIRDVAKLFYAGRLVPAVKNAEGLRAIVADYFGVSARVEEFVGGWLELPERYWCRLGESRENCTLGVSTIVGPRIWECQSRFRIVLGPMHFDDYKRMLPGGDSQKRLVAWVRNYVGHELAFEVMLSLIRAEVPACILGGGLQLGWTSWLKSGDDLGRSPEDLVIHYDE
jgi:type VI secretion system protein ImpH